MKFQHFKEQIFFSRYFVVIDSNLIPQWSANTYFIILIILHLRLVLWLSWHAYYLYLKRLCLNQVKWLIMFFRLSTSLLFLCLVVSSVAERMLKIINCDCQVMFFLLIVSIFFLKYFETLLLCSYTFMFARSSQLIL